MDTDVKTPTLNYSDFEYHQYCTSCGHKIFRGRYWRDHYDSQTGQEVKHFQGICSNYPRFPFPWTNCFKEEFDENEKMVDNYPY